MRNKKIALLFFIVALSFIFINFVRAFGVTAPYWSERPLFMSPGETKTVSFELQNMVGNENLTVKATILNGTEIATLVDSSDSYFVPLGTKDTKANLKITIPADAANGTVYKIAVSFDTITSGTGGGVVIGTGIVKSFDVIVTTEAAAEGEQQKQSKLSAGVIIGIIIIILLIIFFILKLLKKRKASETLKK